MLTRDAILQADDLPRVKVDVPEWGGSVYVRTMSGTERDAFDAAIIGKSGKDGRLDVKGLRVEIVILTTCNADGLRIFTEADAAALGKKSAAALDRVCLASRKLNGLLDVDGTALDDAKKN